MIKVNVLGRTVKDVELKEGKTQSGEDYKMGKICIACETVNSSKEKNDVIYFETIVNGKKADFFAKYLKKGARVLISGDLVFDKYTLNQKEYQTNLIKNADIHIIDFSENENK